MPTGFGTHINAYVVNAVFGTRSLADDLSRMQNTGTKRARPSHVSMYTPIQDLKDYSIQRGELVWDRLGPGGNPRLEEAQQPVVRSVLNGATYMSKNDDDIMPFLKDVRVLGLARDTIAYDSDKIGKAPSSNPVIVVSGVQTSYNFGESTIHPGSALEWYPVSKHHHHQINDGVTVFSSHSRLTFGLRQITMNCNTQTAMEADEGFKKAWTDFVKNVIEVDAIQPNDPVWDGVLRAIQEPIVEAYENHAGCSTTGAPKGQRMNMMISAPFSKIKLGAARSYVVSPPPSGGGGGNPPPPIAKKTLKRSDVTRKLQFPVNVSSPTSVSAPVTLKGSKSPETLDLERAFGILDSVTSKSINDPVIKELIRFVSSEYVRILNNASLDQANKEIALYKITGLFEYLNGLNSSIPLTNYVGTMFTDEVAAIQYYIDTNSSKLSSFVSGATSSAKDEIEFTDGGVITFKS